MAVQISVLVSITTGIPVVSRLVLHLLRRCVQFWRWKRLQILSQSRRYLLYVYRQRHWLVACRSVLEREKSTIEPISLRMMNQWFSSPVISLFVHWCVVLFCRLKHLVVHSLPSPSPFFPPLPTHLHNSLPSPSYPPPPITIKVDEFRRARTRSGLVMQHRRPLCWPCVVKTSNAHTPYACGWHRSPFVL